MVQLENEDIRRRPHGRKPLWLLVPSLLILAIVSYIPILIAIAISLSNLSQFTIGDVASARIVWLKNFVDVLSPLSALHVLRPLVNSISLAALTTVISVPIGVSAALLVNQRFHGRTVLRTVMLIPFILPHFVTALVWRLLFQPSTGAIDTTLRSLHIGKGSNLWLLGPESFWAFLIVSVWISWPFVYIMVLAGLQSVEADQLDAAEIDGASMWRRFRSVTVPSIAPTLALAVCLTVINQFNNFTLPFILFGDPPPTAANVLPVQIYSSSFTSLDFGHASAIAVVNVVVLLVPVIYYLRRVRIE